MYCFLRNSTVNLSDGTFSQEGGAVYHTSSVEGDASYRNCLFWNNHASDFWDVGKTSTASNPVIEHCANGHQTTYFESVSNVHLNSAPNVGGAGSSNPRLAAGTPCIDAGDNTVLPVGYDYDLDSNPRIVGGVVDIGAFEYQ